MQQVKDNGAFVRLASLLAALAIHALILTRGGPRFLRPRTIGDEGGGGPVEVSLMNGPPGEAAAQPAAPVPPPPPPPPVAVPPVPAPPVENFKVDELALPDPTLQEQPLPFPPPRETKQAASNVVAQATAPVATALSGASTGTGQGGGGGGSGGGSGGGTGHGSGHGSGNGWGMVGDMACVYCPKPDYPQDALEMKQQGTVVLRVMIDARGDVSDVAIKQSSGHVLLDQAALRTVRRWKVEPDKTAGVPVGAEAEQVINFELK